MESSNIVQEKLQMAIELADKLKEKINNFQMSLAGFFQVGDKGTVIDMFPSEQEKEKENKQS